MLAVVQPASLKSLAARLTELLGKGGLFHQADQPRSTTRSAPVTF